MSQGDENSKNRILFLLNEQGKGNEETTGMLIGMALAGNDLDFAKQLANYGDLSIHDDKTISKIASLNDRTWSDMLLNAFSKYEVQGQPLTEGIHDYYDVERGTYHSDASKLFFQYVDDVTKYNQQCNKVLDIAINSENQYLAKKIILLFKQKANFLQNDGDERKEMKAPDGSGTKIPYYRSYVWYTDDAQEVAQKKYNEAVRNGAFK